MGTLLHTGDVDGRYHRFPDLVSAGEATWVKLPGRHAIVDDNAETAEFPSSELPPDGPAALQRPVYRRQPGALLGAPTGRVYIRFAPGVRATARAMELAAAGYEIAEVPDYAPASAWLKPRSGDPADGLSHLAGLVRIADVVSVEPQMLLRKVSRQG